MEYICTQRTHSSIHIYIHAHIYIKTCTYTYVYIHIHRHIHLYTYKHIQTYTHIYTHIHAYLYILRRNKQMNGIKKRVQSINTYTTFIDNNRHLYWIILANNNAEKNQFTAINISLEDAVCIYF